jgi:hypothetical protein
VGQEIGKITDEIAFETKLLALDPGDGAVHRARLLPSWPPISGC